MFSAAQQLALAGETVLIARLLEIDAASGPVRLWDGIGTLTTTDGKSWSGMGELIDLGDLPGLMGLAAEKVEMTLSGVPAELRALAAASDAEIQGRDVLVYVQFLNQAGQPVDAPVVQVSYIMERMRTAADAAGQRRIVLEAEGLFSGRRRPPNGTLTDRDQQTRFPGDRGLERVPLVVDRTVTWPAF